MSHRTTEEIKSWLKPVLRGENLEEFSVSCVGNSEKGDGYMGDIVFVDVLGKTVNHIPKTYNLVLKCSKNSEALRKAVPVKQTFENEIYLYENIIPTFVAFQKKKGVKSVFDSIPKNYGSYTTESVEVVVLENLRAKGYYMFDRKLPLPTNHLKLTLREYGKWHAISAAMQDQEPDEFRRLVEGQINVWKLFAESADTETFFGGPIAEIHELLESSLCESTAEKLKKFKSQIKHIVNEVVSEPKCFSVINHGDCWNNNFMFKSEITNGRESLRVAMLDWQTSRFFSPAMDVSYHIFACASKEDMENFDELLKIYYDSFADNVRLLGSDPDNIFPFSQFLKDFQRFGKYGVMLTLLAVKIAVSDKEEAPDFAETFNDIEKTFHFKNRDQGLLKSRMLYIVEKIAEKQIF